MSDALSIPTKTKKEAIEELAAMKAVGYSNLALIGPVSSVQTMEVGGAKWLVVGTNAPIILVPKD